MIVEQFCALVVSFCRWRKNFNYHRRVQDHVLATFPEYGSTAQHHGIGINTDFKLLDSKIKIACVHCAVWKRARKETDDLPR